MTTETKTTVNIDTLQSNVVHPLAHYSGYSDKMCAAFIEVDMRTGTIRADYTLDNSSVPADVWHGHDRHYSIQPDLSTDEINALMGDIAPYAQKLIGLYDRHWDGSNYVARFIDSESAYDAENIITRMCHDAATTTQGVWAAENWFDPTIGDNEIRLDMGCDSVTITADTTDDEIVAMAQAEIDAQTDVTIIGIEDYLRDLRDQL